jgi:F0F1-type ATP synthase membrane subunit c/vacuolar-type H+-ATPase subunit K
VFKKPKMRFARIIATGVANCLIIGSSIGVGVVFSGFLEFISKKPNFNKHLLKIFFSAVFVLAPDQIINLGEANPVIPADHDSDLPDGHKIPGFYERVILLIFSTFWSFFLREQLGEILEDDNIRSGWSIYALAGDFFINLIVFLCGGY